MFQNFQHTKRNMRLAILLYLAIGIILLVWPQHFIQMACNVIGGLMVGFGVITILNEIFRQNKNVLSIGLGIVVAAVGIVIIANPDWIFSIVPIVFGLILLLDGVYNIRHAIGMRRYHEKSWSTILIIGLVTLILGLLVLLHPYGTAQFAFRILGAAMLYNAISDFFVLHHVGRAAKKYVDKDGVHDLIDVDAKPVNDDE